MGFFVITWAKNGQPILKKICEKASKGCSLARVTGKESCFAFTFHAMTSPELPRAESRASKSINSRYNYESATVQESERSEDVSPSLVIGHRTLATSQSREEMKKRYDTCRKELVSPEDQSRARDVIVEHNVTSGRSLLSRQGTRTRRRLFREFYARSERSAGETKSGTRSESE